MQGDSLQHDLYEGRDLLVKYRPASPCRSIVFVTFTAFSDSPTNRKGFGESFFLDRGVSAVHFIAKPNTWWQSAEMVHGIGAAREVLGSFGRIVTYGSSMGAHGALVHSAALGATHVLALAPQFAINGRLSPWLTPWWRHTRDLPEIYRMEDGLSRTADVTVGYDPFHRFDAVHVGRIGELRSIRRLRIGFRGHEVAKGLAEMGLLKPLIAQYEAGTIDPGTIVSQYRRERTKSLTFWLTFMGGVRLRKRVAASEFARKRVLELALVRIGSDAPSDAAELAKALGSTLAGEPAEVAVRIARSLVERFPDSSPCRVLLASMLRRAGSSDEAEHALRKALALQKANYSARLSLGCLLGEKGSVDEAVRVIDHCIDRKLPGRLKDWQMAMARLKPTAAWPEISERLMHHLEELQALQGRLQSG